MKKYIYLFIIIVMVFVYIPNVLAVENAFSLSPSDESLDVTSGKTATVTYSLKSDIAFSSCEFNVDTFDGITLKEKNGMNNWDFTDTDGNKYTIANTQDEASSYPDGKNIFNLVYTVTESGSVSISNITCYTGDTDGEEGGVYAIADVYKTSITANDASDDMTLSGITVSGGTLLTEFKSDTYAYMIELTKKTFSLTLTATNADYQDDIVVTDSSGNVLDPSSITFKNDGSQGLMQITITVNNNTTNQYSIAVKYTEVEELDNSLSSLKVNGSSISLVDGQTDYTYNVDSDVDSVKITATLSDSDNFKFRTGNSPGTYTISDSSTTIALVVVPKDSSSSGTTVTYIIEIKKPSAASSSKTSSSGNSSITNPQTGGGSFYFVGFLLLVSAIGSFVIYKRTVK